MSLPPPAGRSRDKALPADADTPCKLDIHAELFSRVIDLSFNARIDKKRANSRNLAIYVDAAKAVCAECPVRLACLDTHGRDYEAGVVGGLSDAERGKLFGAA